MATDLIGKLASAAKLAKELSASRRKQIRLSVEEDGVMVEGWLCDERGTPLHEVRMISNWVAIVDGRAGDVEFAIRHVDDILTQKWREQTA